MNSSELGKAVPGMKVADATLLPPPLAAKIRDVIRTPRGVFEIVHPSPGFHTVEEAFFEGDAVAAAAERFLPVVAVA